VKLFRLATLHFHPIPGAWRSWSMNNGDVVVETLPIGEKAIEGDRLKLLVSGQVQLESLPDLKDRVVVVPDEPRKKAEAAIEAAANIIAVAEKCKRSISSPFPYIAFLPENDDELTWLEDTQGMSLGLAGIQATKYSIVMDDSLFKGLQDRLDGVALLAETLSHEYPTGRFHEFIRLFERAFHLPPSKFVKKLSQFLAGANQDYERTEVQSWIDLRDPATHADENAYFVLESDVRPIIARMEQAAYDVLFNKSDWHNSSKERRDLWQPPAATTSSTSNLSIKQRSSFLLFFQALDGFKSYPLDLSSAIGKLPEGWWARIVDEEERPNE
jgi:hypothetical protein